MNWKSCGHLPAARSCFAIVPINSDKLFLTRALLQTKTENKKAYRGCGVGPMYGEVQVKQVLTCLRGGVGLGLYTEGVRLGTCIDGWRDQGPVQGPPRQKDTTENNTFPQLRWRAAKSCIFIYITKEVSTEYKVHNLLLFLNQHLKNIFSDTTNTNTISVQILNDHYTVGSGCVQVNVPAIPDYSKGSCHKLTMMKVLQPKQITYLIQLLPFCGFLFMFCKFFKGVFTLTETETETETDKKWVVWDYVGV